MDNTPMFDRIRAVSRARNEERNRVCDLIEQSIWSAKDEATVDALVALANKVLNP